MKPVTELRIAITNDHAGFELKKKIFDYLQNQSPLKLQDFGCQSAESCDYPDYAHPMAKAIEKGLFDYGISICGTGNGISMVMNKHQGIRSALCWNKEVASLARAHNDANVLAMPGRMVTEEDIYEILVTFLNTPFEGGRHTNRINKIPCG